MKRFGKRKILICAAVLLALAMSTQFAMAYFSDYDYAEGEAVVNLTGHTVIKEDVTDNSKTVVIKNTGEADVIVRVAIHGPDGMTVVPAVSSDWHKDGAFWYYTGVLQKGKETSAIVASIENVPVTLENLDLEIIALHESLPLVYDNDGNLNKPDDWTYVPSGI